MMNDPSEFYQSPGAFDERGESVKHSGPGIASFVIALFCGVLEFGLFVGAGMMAVDNPAMNPQDPRVMLVGFGICSGVPISVCGLGLGIAGLFQARRSKLFAVLGVVFNGALLLGIAATMVLGMLMQAGQAPALVEPRRAATREETGISSATLLLGAPVEGLSQTSYLWARISQASPRSVP